MRWVGVRSGGNRVPWNAHQRSLGVCRGCAPFAGAPWSFTCGGFHAPTFSCTIAGSSYGAPVYRNGYQGCRLIVRFGEPSFFGSGRRRSRNGCHPVAEARRPRKSKYHPLGRRTALPQFVRGKFAAWGARQYQREGDGECNILHGQHSRFSDVGTVTVKPRKGL